MTWYKENDYATRKTVEHFESKKNWIVHKQKEKEGRELPDKIDDITMRVHTASEV